MPEKRPRKWLRWAGAAAAVLVLLSVASFTYVYFAVIPRHEIALLKEGYVETIYADGAVHYEFVPEKPDDWASYDALSEQTRAAFVLCEDRRFFAHHGVDPNEIRYAVLEAVRE